ncbi:MAG: NAD(P)/FAD-dependent oxidoreductase [Ginsengibacter sp.]
MKHIIVIGGGAAGFFCAINAAKNNANFRVTILEKSFKLLSKVKVSGGGRCNVSHATNSIADTIKKYPRGERFLKQAFHEFFTNDTIQWFQEKGVELKTEIDGRMFPQSNSSQTIIDCFLNEADDKGIKIELGKEVKSITKDTENFPGQFSVLLKDGITIAADYVCIACGGFPKSLQYEWLQNLGHSIIEPVPSLFTFNIPQHPITQLMGISVENAEVKISGSKYLQSGPLLITHWGISGPVVLKLSAYAARELNEKDYHFSVRINWAPDFNETTFLEKIRDLRNQIATNKVASRNVIGLPNRLWIFLLSQAGIDEDMRWGDLSARHQNLLAKLVCAFEMEIKGKTTFKEEFVTAGGINLSEVNALTMESKIIPQLFFAGEILNVDGITGGYNFQHAWTSGWLAARRIREYAE